MRPIDEMMISDIVLTYPETAAVLEKFNVDFCCKGRRTLSEAMKNDASHLLLIKEELAILIHDEHTDGKTFDSMSLTGLVNHILSEYHEYIKLNAEVIYSHLQKIAAKHGDKHKELPDIAAKFYNLKEDLLQHMMKEETVLFPAIINMDSLTASFQPVLRNISGPVRVMIAEHEVAGDEMEAIRKLTGNYTPPEDACTTYRVAFDELKNFEEKLHLHVNLENNRLFPMALERMKQTA